MAGGTQGSAGRHVNRETTAPRGDPSPHTPDAKPSQASDTGVRHMASHKVCPNTSTSRRRGKPRRVLFGVYCCCFYYLGHKKIGGCEFFEILKKT